MQYFARNIHTDNKQCKVSKKQRSKTGTFIDGKRTRIQAMKFYFAYVQNKSLRIISGLFKYFPSERKQALGVRVNLVNFRCIRRGVRRIRTCRTNPDFAISDSARCLFKVDFVLKNSRAFFPAPFRRTAEYRFLLVFSCGHVAARLAY